jgi:hypothetical protein
MELREEVLIMISSLSAFTAAAALFYYLTHPLFRPPFDRRPLLNHIVQNRRPSSPLILYSPPVAVGI